MTPPLARRSRIVLGNGNTKEWFSLSTLGLQSRRIDGLLLAALVLVLPAGSGLAANGTWKTGAVDAQWSNAANWSASPVPGSADTATFQNPSSFTTIDLGTGVTVKSITFISATAPLYTIGSGGVNAQTLTLSDGGVITVSSTVVTNAVFNATVALADTATSYSVNPIGAGKSLIFEGDITGGLSGSGAKTFTLNPSSTGPGVVLVNGIITDGTATPLTVVKGFGGKATLSGANTYSGDTRVTGGTLALNNVNALQNSTLDTGKTGSQSVTFVAAGVNTYNLGGLKGTNTLAIGANTINVGANNQNTLYEGAITGTDGGLIKSGAGSLTFSGTNTYTGITTISNGTLAISGNGALASAVINNYAVFDVSAVNGGIQHIATGQAFSGTGSVMGSLTVDSGATLTVGGDTGTANIGSMSISGDLTLNGNTVLRINKGGGSDFISVGGVLTLGGTLKLNSVGTALAAGDEFQIFPAGNAGTVVVTGNPGSGLQWDTTLLNSDGKIKAVAGSNPPVFVVSLTNQSVECSSDATFSAIATGTSPLVYTWKVDGNVVQSGTDLTTFATNNVHSAGSSYVVSVEVVNGIAPNATNTCTLSVADSLNPVVTVLGANPISLLVGQSFTDPGATGTDACAGSLAIVTNNTVNPNVAGIYTNSYTANDGNGNITIATRQVNVLEHVDGIWTNTVGGTLPWVDAVNWTNGVVAQGRGAVADFSKVNIAANTFLRLDQPLTVGDMSFGDTSGSQTWGVNNGGNATNVLTLDSSTGISTITVGKDVNFGLQLAGTNRLVKDGTATLSVAASNSYSGGTVIGAGSLKLNASVNSMLGSGDVTIASGARLWDNNSGGDKVFNNNFNIADTGTDGGGVIFLNSGKALIIQGTLTLSASAKIGTANTAANAFIANGPVDLGANTLTLRGSAVAINTGWALNGPITGTGGLDWSAGNPASTLRLAGTNNYSGGTAVSAVLAIASTNALPGWDNASQYSISSGATLAVGNGVSDAAVATMLGTGNFAANAQIGFDTSAGPRTYASGLTDTINGALGLAKVGNNTLTLDGANTYTGTTRINVGELLLNTVTALPGWDTDGRYVVANGATLAVGDSVSDANVVTILATTNFNAGARIGFDTTAGDRTYGNILANNSVGSLGLTKLGNNTLNLPAANTYSGATVVNAGTLAVNGSLGAGAVTVASGGTLGGYGQINGAVTVQDGGTLKLGSTIGTLTISNALTLADNSITWLKLAKGSSPSNDLVQGIRTLTMGGTLTVTTNAGMALLAAGDSFQLFQATNYVGGFAAVNLPALASGLQWDTNGLSSGVLSVVSGVTPTPPAPTLSSLTRSGGNLVLVWNGGTNSTCTLLTATNVAQPLVTWSSVATNTVGADGRSTNTLPINPAEPQRFYRLSIP